jgi:hypothetical protein
MMAQPLAWFEASNLPEEAFEAAPLIRAYREHMADIHAGCILPIGEEPSGAGWTGFQSCGDTGGYLLVFRELNDRPTAEMRLWGLANVRLRLSAIVRSSGKIGEQVEKDVNENGDVAFELSEPFAFALYRYEIVTG